MLRDVATLLTTRYRTIDMRWLTVDASGNLIVPNENVKIIAVFRADANETARGFANKAVVTTATNPET
jgi:Flp pilus assembly protein CpaB